MKNSVFILFLSILLVACSSDDVGEILPPSKQADASNVDKQNNKATIADYKPILQNIYGNYKISQEIIEIEGNYELYKVFKNQNGNQVLGGYFVKNSSNELVFLNHDSAKKTITIFDENDSTKETFNLSNNADYLEYGLTTNPLPNGNKFWGSETTVSTSSCGECICTYSQTSYYVFWIEVYSGPRDLTGVNC